MKKSSLFILLLAAPVVLMLATASSPKVNEREWIPYFMERSALEKSVSYKDEPRKMEDPGKIYIRGSYIFINEKNKGIHIIDNSNPENPSAVAFIVVPGCIDMAVKENIIYVDNAVDLVALDLNTKQVTKRIQDYFPERLSPDGREAGRHDRPGDYVLVGWKKNPDYKPSNQ